MGDRGRLVVPAEVRERVGLDPGTALVLIETPDGLVLVTRDQLKAMVRRDLAGLGLVDELVDQRRKEGAEDNAT